MTGVMRFAAVGGVVILVVGLMVNPARAVLDDYDSFDYSGATALAGQAGGTGWQNGWFQTVGSQPNALSNDGVSLSYPVPFEAPYITPATTGSRVDTGGLSAIASTSRFLANTIPLNVDGTTRYVSALFRKNSINSASSSDSILLEFVDSVGNRRFGVGIEGASDHPWLNANGSTSASGPAVTDGDTYFMVAKIVTSALGSDQAFLKVFGTGYGTQVPVAEPTSWDASASEMSSAILDRIRVRIDQGNTAATPGEIDEIRVATTWAEAVGQALPNLNGDFNNDGKVDAGDYVTWRKNDGTNNALPNDNGLGTPIGQGHYDLWRGNFGSPPGSGSGLFAASVPEPSTILLLPVVMAFLRQSRRLLPHRQQARDG